MWLTQYPQPRPPRETWEDDPIFNAMQQAFTAHHVESPEFMGIHYMDATTVEECWRLLRQTGKSNSYESLANLPRYTEWLERPGLDRRLRAAQAEPPAGRPQRPGEALGAQEPVAHDRARRADDGLPGRADRLHAPRAGHLHRVVLLAVGRDDGRPVRHVRRRRHRPHPARPVVARRSTRSTTPRPKYDQAQFVDVAFKDLRDDPIGVTRADLRPVRPRLDARGAGGDRGDRPRVQDRARRRPSTPTRSRTTGSPSSRCSRRSIAERFVCGLTGLSSRRRADESAPRPS